MPVEVLIPLYVAIAAGVIAGIFKVIDRRSEGRDSKTPTVGEIWARLDRIEAELNTERTKRQTLQSIFRAYIDRVQGGGDSSLTDRERRSLDEPETERTPA